MLPISCFDQFKNNSHVTNTTDLSDQSFHKEKKLIEIGWKINILYNFQIGKISKFGNFLDYLLSGL
jgi:hypothetical protein